MAFTFQHSHTNKQQPIQRYVCFLTLFSFLIWILSQFSFSFHVHVPFLSVFFFFTFFFIVPFLKVYCLCFFLFLSFFPTFFFFLVYYMDPLVKSKNATLASILLLCSLCFSFPIFLGKKYTFICFLIHQFKTFLLFSNFNRYFVFYFLIFSPNLHYIYQRLLIFRIRIWYSNYVTRFLISSI